MKKVYAVDEVEPFTGYIYSTKIFEKEEDAIKYKKKMDKEESTVDGYLTIKFYEIY